MMKELLEAIEVEQQNLQTIEVAAAQIISKEERRRLCREMHQGEQLLAALEKRLDAVIESGLV